MNPLVVLLGATASGKTALSLALAQHFAGEIISCDSVAVYRGMELGTAKPTPAERALVPHHGLDLYDLEHACTAGDYSRSARESLAGITERGHLPIVAGGTGLYLRALIDGLFPSPPADPGLRERLRRRTPERLHTILERLDPKAAALIHRNDVPKVIRAIEVSLAARRPITEQWEAGRDALTGYRILRIGLNPPRAELYHRINQRAAAMFHLGLVAETEALIARHGADSRPLTSLGYAEASAVLRGELTLDQAIAQAQQGHRNYAKRQMTWFRREPGVHWLEGTGDDPEVLRQAVELVEQHAKQ
ncbi:tRNA (adenosine(37)-N6)-dimethylallyltransferase MiaA [Granulicella sp. WH15]|uniref:tRNA (adenosine(37)-N6)-dimethylallyltransferase MiaA n=1 Tax=Granulicella sp. WH15 TaxID=2602070 RepID=UPI001366B652|nr:tRNA (adenosine(37)-N6)-dimethylallyltransferase MiaA [Granulicella sp. WH15]QHN02058.1 tRNA (adenosine(37)-N6)-dimethylallyltransferase MiaA [Granulicella sp. WH15]